MNDKFKEGNVCKSISGHDKGKVFIVVKVEKDYCYIVNGKSRKLEKPKKKKIKHLDFIADKIKVLSDYIEQGQEIGNETIRKSLTPYKIKK